MKKLLKWLGIALLAILVLLLAHPLWIGAVGRIGANIVVPYITGTEFHLGKLSVNLYSGRVCVGDLNVGNPSDFKNDPWLLTLGAFSLEFQPATIFDVLVVNDILINDAYVTYVKASGRYNVDAIKENIFGPEEAAAEGDEAGEKADDGFDFIYNYRVIIDRIAISGVTFKYLKVPVPVPPLTLKDIGRSAGGVSINSAYKAVWDQLKASVDLIGNGLESLGGGAVDLGNGALKQSQKLSDGAKNLGKSAESLGKTLKGLFNKSEE